MHLKGTNHDSFGNTTSSHEDGFKSGQINHEIMYMIFETDMIITNFELKLKKIFVVNSIKNGVQKRIKSLSSDATREGSSGLDASHELLFIISFQYLFFIFKLALYTQNINSLSNLLLFSIDNWTVYI